MNDQYIPDDDSVIDAEFLPDDHPIFKKCPELLHPRPRRTSRPKKPLPTSTPPSPKPPPP